MTTEQNDRNDPAQKLYKTREEAIWGGKRLANSDNPNVKIDGLLQMAADCQVNKGCLAGVMISWFSTVARLGMWSDDAIRESLEHGRDHAKMRKKVGAKFGEGEDVSIHIEIPLPSLPFRRKRK